MKIKLIPVIAFGLLLAACGGCGNDHGKTNTHLAKGGVYYGGVFRLNWVIGFRSLFPDNWVFRNYFPARVCSTAKQPSQ